MGLGYECGVGQHKQETQLHNQEISGVARQEDLFRLVKPVGDLNRDLRWGFLALAREKNTQRLHKSGVAS